MKLAEIQKLKIAKKDKHGLFLEDEAGEKVLLPNRECHNLNIGEEIEVFIYKDSDDRLVATRKVPKIKLGQLKELKVKDKTKIGAFLDWGLDKDLLLPFTEQLTPVEVGKDYLVKLYIDKTNRLAATSRIYDDLISHSPYKKGDWIEGLVYHINPKVGAYIAVDKKYHGLVKKQDLNNSVQLGNVVKLRVMDVAEDGKLQLSPIKKAHKEIEPNAEMILKYLKEHDGKLNLNDKSSPEEIRKVFDISKGNFKKALGNLLKKKLIFQTSTGIELKNG